MCNAYGASDAACPLFSWCYDLRNNNNNNNNIPELIHNKFVFNVSEQRQINWHVWIRERQKGSQVKVQLFPAGHYSWLGEASASKKAVSVLPACEVLPVQLASRSQPCQPEPCWVPKASASPRPGVFSWLPRCWRGGS